MASSSLLSAFLAFSIASRAFYLSFNVWLIPSNSYSSLAFLSTQLMRILWSRSRPPKSLSLKFSMTLPLIYLNFCTSPTSPSSFTFPTSAASSFSGLPFTSSVFSAFYSSDESLSCSISFTGVVLYSATTMEVLH